MKLAGKKALITGGNSGIGLATARLFISEGAEVAISGRDQQTLGDLEEHRRRGADAKARLGEAFPLQGELDAKLAQHADIEADLASTEGLVDETGSEQRREAA